jgi:hypothetical protein
VRGEAVRILARDHRRVAERFTGEWLAILVLRVAYDRAGQVASALAFYHRIERLTLVAARLSHGRLASRARRDTGAPLLS